MPHSPERPSYKWVFSKPERVIAFGFGSGLIYPAPGTWGTLVGWLLWVVLLAGLPDYIVTTVLLVSFALGCIFAQRCGKDLGIADHSGINWDEIVAIWLVLWLVPDTFWYQLLAVIVFRLFDILKPPPINIFDARFKNGFGVMIDDVIAAVYSLLSIHIFILLVGKL